MRAVSELAWATLIVVSLAVILGIVLFTPTATIRKFTVETVSSACLTGENEIQIKAVESSIVIIAPIKTPNPCYSVVGDVKFSGRDIEVDLSALSKQDVCTQCIGEVTGRVVIQNLTKGTYGVKVKTPDKAAITTIMIN